MSAVSGLRESELPNEVQILTVGSSGVLYLPEVNSKSFLFPFYMSGIIKEMTFVVVQEKLLQLLPFGDFSSGPMCSFSSLMLLPFQVCDFAFLFSFCYICEWLRAKGLIGATVPLDIHWSVRISRQRPRGALTVWSVIQNFGRITVKMATFPICPGGLSV